ncbi:hypothetical protein RJ639_021167, partial [Escallonia herrerae]
MHIMELYPQHMELDYATENAELESTWQTLQKIQLNFQLRKEAQEKQLKLTFDQEQQTHTKVQDTWLNLQTFSFSFSFLLRQEHWLNQISDISSSGMQIKEVLQLQLDVQRRLHEQLEIQRNLQLRIKEQGKQLKMMFDQQQEKNKSLLETQNLHVMSPSDRSISLGDIQSYQGARYMAESA